MDKFKSLRKISKHFIDKKKHKNINKIKDKEERLIVLQNSLVSHLRLKHLYVIILLFYVLQYRTTYVFLINSEIYLDETNYICYALSALSKMLHALWDVP